MKPSIGLALITLGACILAAAVLVYLINQDARYLQDYGGIAAGVMLLGFLVTKGEILEEETDLRTARMEFLKLLSEEIPEEKAINQICNRFPYTKETVAEWSNEFNMAITDLRKAIKDEK